ncbi:MAG: hypothetical protein Fur0018_12100 [Anaerolineales bacterium]
MIHTLLPALLLIVLGQTHRHPFIAGLDDRLFLALHRPLRRAPCDRIFRSLWPLGTTPVTLMVLLALILWNWQAGLSAAGGYALGAGLERLVKITLRRARPFEHLPDVSMLQPRRPHDPSYPSGDALRVWFLAVSLTHFLGLAGESAAVLFLLAFLVSLGRIALGVHHPLDVLSGSGLGVFSAWLTAMLHISFLA